ncbi:hypothetical protein V9P86_32370, partial [Pseudomonas aeruginosa]
LFSLDGRFLLANLGGQDGQFLLELHDSLPGVPLKQLMARYLAALPKSCQPTKWSSLQYASGKLVVNHAANDSNRVAYLKVSI